MIDFLFEPGVYRAQGDLVVWLELVTLAARDAVMREELQRLWRDRWLPDIERRMSAEFPHASPARVRAAAYGLVALFEGHWSLSAQGVHDEQTTAAVKAAALAVVGTLDELSG